jgi:hypothetical protein
VKRFTSLKGGEQNGSSGKEKKMGNPLTSGKHKKGSSGNDNTVKNNPYPESGFVRQQSPRSSRDGQLSFATPAHPRNDDGSSVISGGPQERESHPSNRSKAPTVATIPDTVNSDTGHSKAFTTTTGGALSSIDGAGNGSTFSSPNHSNQSLTTTLTTIQSTSPANTLQQANNSHSHGHHLGQPAVMFSHQYPVSPAFNAPSAIPRHLTTNNDSHQSALLTDDASIVTLASSSKRRRRSMDTDASVRALAPGSVWGGSRESLPLSVLSGNVEASDRASTTGLYSASIRPSMGGLASAERASIYSSQGVAAPALASERNSYYAVPRKELGDAKSLRSLTGFDGRSQYDARSINNVDSKSLRADDARSLRNQEGSIRNYEGSIRSGALGHGRNDSIPGSIGSPLASPGFVRQASASGFLIRRSSDWQDRDDGADKKEEEVRGDAGPVKQ